MSAFSSARHRPDVSCDLVTPPDPLGKFDDRDGGVSTIGGSMSTTFGEPPGLVAEQRLVSCAARIALGCSRRKARHDRLRLRAPGSRTPLRVGHPGELHPSPDDSCTDRAQDVPVPPEIMTNDPDDATRSPSSEHTHWTTKDESNVPGQT
jgi:hypothetical protein